jgi:sulfur-oxidizing protein SoxY
MIAQKMTPISRRHALSLLGASASLAMLPGLGFATEEMVAGRISEVTGGKAVGDLEIYLDMPDIAENGNQVKVAFSIESLMTEADHVKTVYVFADGNPEPDVAQFNFTPAMGACSATTRMRLSKTQNVTVLAALSDGSFAKADTTVKVTIGGCGG